MTEPFSAPSRIAIATNPQQPDAEPIARQVAAFLDSAGIHNTIGMLHEEQLQQQVCAGEFDVMLALGGDGTMLRAAHLCAPCGVPILGINLGRLGFLTEVGKEEWQPAVERVLQADCWIERRMMLKAQHIRAGKLLGEWTMLNECVIGRGGSVRPVRLITEIDKHFLTTYVADALIVATATGSTAYALAAGGPILPPELRNLLIVPVAPHLSVDRAVVLHEGTGVSVTVRTDHEALISVDGQSVVDLMDQDQVYVCAGEHVVDFLRLQDPGYFYRNLTSHMNKNPSAGKVS